MVNAHVRQQIDQYSKVTLTVADPHQQCGKKVQGRFLVSLRAASHLSSM